MKTAVIYSSKTGYTKRYAQWISEELSADIFESSRINIDMLKDYDTIIFGGGLYASAINGVKLITNNLNKIKDKRIVVFATGLSPIRKDVIDDVTTRNFTQDELNQIEFFYFRGGFNYNLLSIVDKILMKMFKRRIENKRKKGEELTDDEIEVLKVFDRPVDYTDRNYIKELIDYVKCNP